MNINEKLSWIQGRISVPKGNKNPGSGAPGDNGFMYRSLPDILERLKPLTSEAGVVVYLTDEVAEIAGAPYVKATAVMKDLFSGEVISSTAYAREECGDRMFAPQFTGSSSTYARKYALGGLLMLDDAKGKDPDAMVRHPQGAPSVKPQKAEKPADTGKAKAEKPEPEKAEKPADTAAPQAEAGYVNIAEWEEAAKELYAQLEGMGLKVSQLRAAAGMSSWKDLTPQIAAAMREELAALEKIGVSLPVTGKKSA